MMNGQAHNPPPRRRISAAEMELQARQASELTTLMAKHYNERFDLDELHAQQRAQLLASLELEPAK